MLGMHAASIANSKRRSFVLAMVSSANDWSTVHTRGLPRKRDAKNFRGDVSEKIQVHRASSQYTVRELKLFNLNHIRFSNDADPDKRGSRCR